MTGSGSATPTGRQTSSVRLSSLVGYGFTNMSAIGMATVRCSARSGKVDDSRPGTAENAVASRTSVHGRGGSGGRHRRSPTGGAA